MSDRNDVNFASLPVEIPIFPLSGTILLPRTRLPLNIFEERYRNMVEDVLGSGRYMGMIQPLRASEGIVPDDAPVFDVGCIGRMTAFEETGDGRFLISLTGLCRFRIVQELGGNGGYRRWQVDYGPYLNDLGRDDTTLDDRETLLECVKAYFESRGLRADWKAIEAASDEALATSLSMVCPFDDMRDKQALLESPNTAARGDVLRSLLQMALYNAGTLGTGKN